jgi:hypothetical protein
MDTSLSDLGISLTGAVLVDIQYTTKSFLQKFLEEIGPIFLFFWFYSLF